jgi:cyclic pyranopterin phosphate synthase
MIVDRQGRRFRNLRISLTSACNYACTYCVPNGKRLVAAQDELSAEAMARGVAYLIEAAGIERLAHHRWRTAGQPQTRIVHDRRRADGPRRHQPDHQRPAAREETATAGGCRFAAHQRFPRYPRCQCIPQHCPWRRSGDCARRHGSGGTRPGMKIKVNMVPLRGQNLDQVMPLLDYCLERGYELRFHRTDAHGPPGQRLQCLPATVRQPSAIAELIGERYEYLQADAPVDATAVRYAIAGRGHFGVIANESVPFCRTCSRCVCRRRDGCMAACRRAIATMSGICSTSRAIRHCQRCNGCWSRLWATSRKWRSLVALP